MFSLVAQKYCLCLGQREFYEERITPNTSQVEESSCHIFPTAVHGILLCRRWSAYRHHIEPTVHTPGRKRRPDPQNILISVLSRTKLQDRIHVATSRCEDTGENSGCHAADGDHGRIGNGIGGEIDRLQSFPEGCSS